MDARRWHHQCMTDPPSRPTAISIQQATAMTPAERKRYAAQVQWWMRQRSLETPELQSLAEALTAAEEANRHTPPGAKQILAVSGPNGVGKSTLMRSWAAARYREWIRDETEASNEGIPIWRPAEFTECDIIPVCWINLHSAARVKDLNSQILDFLGLPSKDVTSVQTGRIIRAWVRHRTRLLVIDDVHLLKLTEKIGRDVLDHLKHLNTELGELGGTVILIGANLDGSRLVADPQIAARLEAHHLTPHTIATKTGKRRWQQLLEYQERALAPLLPLSTPGSLHVELAGELWKRTQGYLGDLKLVLAAGTDAAITNGTYRIAAADIRGTRLSARAEHQASTLIQGT